jgi:hypothetical protein
MIETLNQFLAATQASGEALQFYVHAEHRFLERAILSAFTLVNSLRILAYVPQIIKAARDENGASAISCMTWGLFLLSHLTTIAYAAVCLGDLIMAAIFLGNALACSAIVGITLAKRHRHRKNGAVEPAIP